MFNEQWTGEDLKGSGRGLLWDTVLSCMKELRKTYKAVRVPNFRAQVTTVELSNTTQKGRCADREISFVVRRN